MSQFLQGLNAIYTVHGGQLVEDGNSWDRAISSFDYRRRGRMTVHDSQSWISLWHTGAFTGYGDGGEQLSYYDRNQSYNRWSITGRGKRTYKVITGAVVDTNGTPVTGANLSLFLTANNNFVTSGTSDSNGNYEIGTEFTANNHYIVAYVDTATDKTGTSINNLTPLNRDGT